MVRHPLGSDRAQPGDRQGYVVIAEMVDPEDPGRFSARFAAHWEASAGTDWKPGPENAEVLDAVAWGRGHAPIVVVRTGDGPVYSAGKRQVDDDEAKPWPLSGIRIAPRPLGTPLDGSVQSVLWLVKMETGWDGEDLDRVLEVVAGEPELVRVGRGDRPGAGLVFVEGAGVVEVDGIVWGAINRALAVLASQGRHVGATRGLSLRGLHKIDITRAYGRVKQHMRGTDLGMGGQ